MNKHVLILGSGSVGKRHAANLHTLGARVSCMDPRADRVAEAAEATPLEGTYTSLEDAFASSADFDGVVVGSPTAFHVDQSVAALEHGLPVLLEKPVSKDLASALRLQAAARKTGVPVLMGYTWRWWPPLLRAKQLIDEGAIGTVLNVKFTLSAHLADWHPWERYQDFFMSSLALGGGALLDESHWLDLLVWFFGPPNKLYAQVEHLSSLEIETDDNVDILASWDSGLRASLHLDLYGRPHERSVTFYGEGATLAWSENKLALSSDAAGNWTEEGFDHDRNDMFMGVAREFLALLNGSPATTCTLDQGVEVMRLIEAARLSSLEERAIRPMEVVPS